MLDYLTPNNRLGRILSVSFNFVTERIAVGGEILSKADVDQIVGAGITHVIDMRAKFDDDTLNDNRITILWLPQVDGLRFGLPDDALVRVSYSPPQGLVDGKGREFLKIVLFQRITVIEGTPG
jgi:hypothetical protein